MASTLTVIWWRDIPSQVMAGQGRGARRVALGDRFQLAIDRAAARAGLEAEDAYLAEWRRVSRPCGDDLEAEAAAEAARLETAYPADLLNRLAVNHGLVDAATETQPEPGI
jgi:Virulence factor